MVPNSRNPCAFAGCIKQMELPDDDGPILCLFRIVLVVVLVLVIGLFARVFDYDYEDNDEDDMRIAPSTQPETLAALARSSLMQPYGEGRTGLNLLTRILPL